MSFPSASPSQLSPVAWHPTGAGTPGSSGGGNTSDGVANGATTGPISLNSNGSHTVDIKFGPVNTSSLGNQGNNVLIRFGVASGKSVTAFSAS